MQRHEEVRNPDGMPCEFSGRGSAKNWYYWVESDAAGAAVGQAVGQKRRHWYAAGGDGRAYKDGVKLLKARAKAGDIDEIVPWHHGSSLPQLATSSIVASTVGSSLPTNSFTLATSAIAVPPPPPLPPLPPSQQMLLPAFPSSSSGAEYGASLGCAGPAYAESVEAPLQDQIAQPALRQHDGGPVIDQRAQALTHPYSLHGACDVSVRDVCVPSDQRQLGSAASTLMTTSSAATPSSSQPPPALLMEALASMLRDRPSLLVQLNARLPTGYAWTLPELPPPPLPPPPAASTAVIFAPSDEKGSRDLLQELLRELRHGELSAERLRLVRGACEPGGCISGGQRVKLYLNAHGTEPAHLAGRCWGQGDAVAEGWRGFEDPSFGAKVAAMQSGDSDSLLVSSARYGREQMMQLLIEVRADVNQVSGYGESPLFAACLESQIGAV
jgi:hypothetical protein